MESGLWGRWAHPHGPETLRKSLRRRREPPAAAPQSRFAASFAPYSHRRRGHRRRHFRARAHPSGRPSPYTPRTSSFPARSRVRGGPERLYLPLPAPKLGGDRSPQSRGVPDGVNVIVRLEIVHAGEVIAFDMVQPIIRHSFRPPTQITTCRNGAPSTRSIPKRGPTRRPFYRCRRSAAFRRGGRAPYPRSRSSRGDHADPPARVPHFHGIAGSALLRNAHGFEVALGLNMIRSDKFAVLQTIELIIRHQVVPHAAATRPREQYAPPISGPH